MLSCDVLRILEYTAKDWNQGKAMTTENTQIAKEYTAKDWNQGKAVSTLTRGSLTEYTAKDWNQGKADGSPSTTNV